MQVLICGILFGCLCLLVAAAPQGNLSDRVQEYKAYDYQYKVEDAEKQLFYDKQEAGDDNGLVTGKYSVLLPDGRLMIVEYKADLQNGYVPRISFLPNANPFVG